MKWYERVKSKLKDRDIRQYQFAEMLNVTEGMVSQYLKGKKSPSLRIIRKMSDVLDMPMSELLGDDARIYSNEHQIKAADLIKEMDEEQRETAIRVLESFLKAE